MKIGEAIANPISSIFRWETEVQGKKVLFACGHTALSSRARAGTPRPPDSGHAPHTHPPLSVYYTELLATEVGERGLTS